MASPLISAFIASKNPNPEEKSKNKTKMVSKKAIRIHRSLTFYSSSQLLHPSPALQTPLYWSHLKAVTFPKKLRFEKPHKKKKNQNCKRGKQKEKSKCQLFQTNLVRTSRGTSSRGSRPRCRRIFRRILRPGEQICGGCVRLPHWGTLLHCFSSLCPTPIKKIFTSWKTKMKNFPHFNNKEAETLEIWPPYNHNDFVFLRIKWCPKILVLFWAGTRESCSWWAKTRGLFQLGFLGIFKPSKAL